MTRLALRRETLTELSANDLGSVVGAATTSCPVAVPTLDACFTGVWPTFDGCTDLTQLTT